MIAKYPSTCMFCRKPITPGVDTYDLDTKKSWHEECFENQPPSAEAYELAARLGFIEYSQDMAADGILLRMQKRPGGPTAGWNPAPPHQNQDSLWPVSGDDKAKTT